MDRETAVSVEQDGRLVGTLYNYRAREYSPQLGRFSPEGSFCGFER